MKSTIKNWKASEIAAAVYVFAVVVGLPLVVRNAYYDINVVKYYYYCGASLLLIPILVLKAREGVSAKGFLASLSPGEKALLVFWAVSVLSTLFSKYRFESFWGNEGRFSGLFLMTIYVAAYFVIARCYRPHPALVYAAVAAGCVTFVIGVTDFFKLDIFAFKEIIMEEQYDRFISTVGNINFYTSYAGLIAGAAATVYTLRSGEDKAKNALWFGLMTLSFIGMIVGNSDNAYLSLGVVTAFLPLYLFRTRRAICRYFMMLSSLLLSFALYKLCCIRFEGIVQRPQGVNGIIARWDGFFVLCAVFWAATAALCAAAWKSRKLEEPISNKVRIVWGIMLVGAAAGVIAVLTDANLLGHGERYGALQGFVVFNDDWGTHRGFAWRKALENYGNFPLMQKIFGHGPDTFGIISYFRDLAESTAMYGELFDSAHNEYLQFLVTIGPIGTAAYMLFLALSVRDMLKSQGSPYVAAMAFAVSCYCVQAVVNINQPMSTPIMWTFLAMGIAEYRRGALYKKGEEGAETERKEQNAIGKEN